MISRPLVLAFAAAVLPVLGACESFTPPPAHSEVTGAYSTRTDGTPVDKPLIAVGPAVQPAGPLHFTGKVVPVEGSLRFVPDQDPGKALRLTRALNRAAPGGPEGYETSLAPFAGQSVQFDATDASGDWLYGVGTEEIRPAG